MGASSIHFFGLQAMAAPADLRVLSVAKKEVDSVKQGRRVYDNRGTRVLFLSDKHQVASNLQKKIDHHSKEVTRRAQQQQQQV